MTREKVRAVPAKLRVSQSVFAHKLRAEVRTIENWEQGTAKPNAQAAILLALVDHHPELFDEIAPL